MKTWLVLFCLGVSAFAAESENGIFAGKLQQLEATHAGEGPAWDVKSKALYYTGGGRISRFANGRSEVFREEAGGANGLLFDPEGRLVTCEAANRRVTRTEANGTITVLADSFEGKKFNSPNDLTIDSKGRIYFTDPRYGNRDSMEMREEAVYRIDGPGKVARIITELERPNGILVSADDRFLFVADNNNNKVGGARKLWKFRLNPDGTLRERTKRTGSKQKAMTLVFDWKTSRGPDGLKMDRKGRLFVAAGLNKASSPFETVEPNRAGVYVLSAEGKLLDFVGVPQDEVTNCAFGGEDLKTLLITAGGTLWSIQVNTPGRIIPEGVRD